MAVMQPPGGARKITTSIRGVLRLVWAQIGLAFLVGLALIYLIPKTWAGYLLFEHIGLGLIVAAVVTVFWQLREISEFFQTLARSTLIDDSYLEKLNLESLRRLRSSAASAILDKSVNNPRYDWRDLERWVDTQLFEKCLPGTESMSGVYRENLVDHLTLEFLTLRDFLSAAGRSTAGVREEILDSDVLRQTLTTRYTVIAPQVGGDRYAAYKVSFNEKPAIFPDLPTDLRFQFFAGTSESTAVEVMPQRIESARGIGFVAERDIPLVEGRTDIWTRQIACTMPLREPFILQTMKDLTHNLRVHLSVAGARQRFVFDGEVIGFGGSDRVEYLPNGITVEYAGWLFEDHGYILWWWQM